MHAACLDDTLFQCESELTQTDRSQLGQITVAILRRWKLGHPKHTTVCKSLALYNYPNGQH